jgi:hypothetical protein
MPDDRNHKLIKELASAVSTQAQFANRIWLALMTVALFAVLPHVPKSNGNLSLPFNLGEVDAMWFHTVVFALLVVLVITFASAHPQHIRAHSLAQDSISASPSMSGHIHPREMFDMLRMPSFNRVAPLAQVLRGKYQYYKTNRDCPAWLLRLTVVYYSLLKIASLAVYFTLPFWAIWHVYTNVLSVQSAWFVSLTARVGAFLAGSALLVVLIVEIQGAFKIVKHLWLPLE